MRIKATGIASSDNQYSNIKKEFPLRQAELTNAHRSALAGFDWCGEMIMSNNEVFGRTDPAVFAA
jgi:hypothetical protein